MLGGKLLTVGTAFFLLGQSSFASEDELSISEPKNIISENPDEKAIIENIELRWSLREKSVVIFSLEKEGKFLEAYTMAAELKTRYDEMALETKCMLSTLLPTFSEDEATHFSEISGIDKDMIYGDGIVEVAFNCLLSLHHRAISSGNFQLCMRGKKACKLLLNKHPNYTYQESVDQMPLTFAEIMENIKNIDDMGRELIDGPLPKYGQTLLFFYPDNEEMAWKILSAEEDKLPKD
ncbi:MAG: hypothetical protein LBI26_02680 [Holosporales bacterium]|jgi:hypothetical protein|nr:hypothetical protein [Holosporales bacterium]